MRFRCVPNFPSFFFGEKLSHCGRIFCFIELICCEKFMLYFLFSFFFDYMLNPWQENNNNNKKICAEKFFSLKKTHTEVQQQQCG